MSISRKRRLIMCIVLLFWVNQATADSKWYSFSAERVPDYLGYRVNEYTGSIRLTFLGDCTLGGEQISLYNRYGFVRTMENQSPDYPFYYLRNLTENDDISVANLQGVLTDRELPKVQKTYNFKGPASYTEILKCGSIECVTLANNHSGDYGKKGLADTQDALESAGIAWISTDRVAVCDIDGLLIGFAGINITLNGAAGKKYRQQVQALKDAGCAAVITLMHAGTEYDYTPNVYQNRMVKRAVNAGTDLIIGHHPHVVQGYDVVEGVPVVYSLGNCSFGGNTYPIDTDGLIVQAELIFDEGILQNTILTFYPIRISGTQGYNNYQPVFLEGSEKQKILDKMIRSTGNGFQQTENIASVTIERVRGNPFHE